MGHIRADLFRKIAADAAEELKVLDDTRTSHPSPTGEFSDENARENARGQSKLFQLMMLRAANFMEWHYGDKGGKGATSAMAPEDKLAVLDLTVMLSNKDFRPKDETEQHLTNLSVKPKVQPSIYDRKPNGAKDPLIEAILTRINDDPTLFGCT